MAVHSSQSATYQNEGTLSEPVSRNANLCQLVLVYLEINVGDRIKHLHTRMQQPSNWLGLVNLLRQV